MLTSYFQDYGRTEFVVIEVIKQCKDLELCEQHLELPRDERCSKVETPLNLGVSNANLQQVPQRNTTYYNDVKVKESELLTI